MTSIASHTTTVITILPLLSWSLPLPLFSLFYQYQFPSHRPSPAADTSSPPLSHPTRPLHHHYHHSSTSITHHRHHHTHLKATYQTYHPHHLLDLSPLTQSHHHFHYSPRFPHPTLPPPAGVNHSIFNQLFISAR